MITRFKLYTEKFITVFDSDGIKYNESVLLGALRSNNVNVFKKYLELGGDPNTEFANSSLLYYAVDFDRYEISKLLIDAGADVNFKKNILPHLTIVMMCSDLKIMKLLIDAGAKIDLYKDYFGRDIFDINVGDVETLKIRKFLIVNYPDLYKEHKMKKKAEEFNL